MLPNLPGTICCSAVIALFPSVSDPKTGTEIIHNHSLSIAAIPLPEGFERIPCETHSFGSWLRNVRLKPDKTIYLYNGMPKRNQQVQYAVLDISTGTKDLQQCADAVMRLRAEYLYSSNRIPEIVFRDNSGKKYSCPPKANRQEFNVYLEQVFSWCGTLSLEKQLNPVRSLSEVAPGDVFIKGGSPGHAAIVMDVAQNPKGEKIVLIANSYMPAQDIHIVLNPGNELSNPWYSIDKDDFIQIPEWIFYKNQLRRW